MPAGFNTHGKKLYSWNVPLNLYSKELRQRLVVNKAELLLLNDTGGKKFVEHVFLENKISVARHVGTGTNLQIGLEVLS